MEETTLLINSLEESMKNAIVYLEKEFHKYRTGKATPQMLEGVKVDYYGTLTPLDQVCNINTPDAHQIIVQPWEKSMLDPIQKAIINANLGLNPQNNGEILRINVPALTEERRKDIVKTAKVDVENAKVTIRAIRRNGIEALKKMEKDGLPEDETKIVEKNIQTITDKYIEEVDKAFDIKEKEILTV